MANNLFITATEARSGKSVISLGVMEMLLRKIDKVSFFRPIITGDPGQAYPDQDIDLMASHFQLAIPYEHMYGSTATEASTLLSLGKDAELLEGIIQKYRWLEARSEFILCEGTDFDSSTAAFEFDINAEMSCNLGCPVLLVANASHKSIEDTVRSIELALESLEDKGCQIVATIVNRPALSDRDAIIARLNTWELAKDQAVYAIPDEAVLGKPTVGDIARFVGAEVLYGADQLHRPVHNFTVAAMQLRNFLTRIDQGSLIITPGDRADVIMACLAMVSSTSRHTIAGLLLTGGLTPEAPIWNLIKGVPHMVPILSVTENTFPTATMVDKIHTKISPYDDGKITRALALFEQHVDVKHLGETVITTRTSIVTPNMFEYDLLQQARAHKQHIVLAEGEDERILRAADLLLRRKVVDLTLLGDEQAIRDTIARLDLHLDPVSIINPLTSNRLDDYAQTFYELRNHKRVTRERARDTMGDVNFFGTMMVYQGHADGMVSGARHSTGATILPALQIIKTTPGVSLVSSVFFMCLDRVLVYGDCAVNVNPTAQQLAEIALSSAQTAKAFGIEPIVAMLSYSTGDSGSGADVDRVHDATRLAQEMAQTVYPGLNLEGPIQYDAAVDPEVARVKMPGSAVAGKATVFIFPDLNTGNNTYKAVQRSAGAVAIGPVLQGLKHPVNDLSRGCTVPDIINTVAITAIQAQAEKELV